MILRKKGPTLFCLLLLELAVSYSQEDRSYDTSDWIPISEPCRSCKKDQYASASKTTGRRLNLREYTQKRGPAFKENRNTRQANNYQQYITQNIGPPTQKNIPNNKNYAQQNLQQNAQYKVPQEQRSAAQLQQEYTNQHLLPNIDLITRQVLQHTQNLAAQQNQPQNVNAYQTAPQIYNPALFQQNLLKQNYPSVPQQFSLPQHLQPQQAHLVQQQEYLQQQLPQLPQTQQALQQNIQPLINSQQQIQQVQNQNYDGSDIQNINHGLANVADQTYKNVDITSTTPKSEKEDVQLLYVPLEHLQQKHQRTRPAKVHRQKQVSQPIKQENLLENIQKDFIEQALQAHKLQQQFDQGNFRRPPAFTPPQQQTTTLKPISRKRKPHQPPLAVYMNGFGNTKVTDVLNILKDAKTIDVQDTIGPESPHVFVGPANLDPPEGFSKFELPYLSNIESNRIERKVDQLPFFVAPLNYNTPAGYSKIPFPSPHVGSVVVNTNELEKPNPLETVPSVEDFLNPYQSSQIQQAPLPNVNQQTQTENVKTVTQEAVPTYYVRKPSRTRGRQQSRSRPNAVTHTEQTTPKLVQENSGQNSFNSNPFTGISSTLSPNVQAYRQYENIPNVEINNPSLNLNNQLKSQSATDYFPSTNIDTQHQQQRQKPQKNEATTPQADYVANGGTLNQQSNLNYFSEISNVTPVSSVKSDRKQQISTPKYFTDFEIVPSISSTIPPYNDKHGVQEFFQQFENLQGPSAIPSSNTYETDSNPTKNQNIKQLTNDNIEDVYSIIPTVSTTEKNTKDDRRYLPLDSQVRTPAPQIDYDDFLQLPLANQVRHNQKESDLRTAGLREVQPVQDVSVGIQGNPPGGEKFAFLEEYPVRSSGTTTKEQNPEAFGQAQHQTSEGDYQEAHVRKAPTRQRTRGRTQGTRHQAEVQTEHIPRQPIRNQKERNREQINHENYNSVPTAEAATGQALNDNNNNAQSLSDLNTYQNSFHESPSPIASPVLPGLINSLEDASIRQLLTPILLAPAEKLAQLEEPKIKQPVQVSTANDQVSHTTPATVNYNYEHYTSTTSQPTTTTPPIIEIETTTQKRQRGRGRGHSRYNDRTTTDSPRRSPHRTRTQHPSRTRYRQETTTQDYVPIKQSVYTSTTEAPRKTQIRQRFRTRGRPIQSEQYTSTPTARLNVYRTPETTTVQIEVVKEEIQPEVEVQHSLYAEQPFTPIRKPQLITRSKILSPEEEYLVNKYNLEVSAINDPITENLKQQYPLYNEKEESPEQKIDSSKTVNIAEPYPTTSAVPVTTEFEITTFNTPTKQTYLSRHHIDRNLIRTEHSPVKTRTEHPPVKIRTRVRGRKTTQRPTTTSTTSTAPPMISSASSVEEQEEEFYGFIRQPAFKNTATTEAAPKPLSDNSLYAPIIINGSPSSSVYDDEYVDTNEDGIQIYTNNQQSPSSPVHFIGELLPKVPITSEKYYEAIHEPLPSADRYVSIPVTTVTTTSTTTTTEAAKRRGRLPLRGRNAKQPANRDNAIQTSEQVAPRTTQRTRTRGRAHYKLPASVTTEQSSGTDNYPQSYLIAKDNKQQYTAPIVKQQTERPTFQITIDPDDGNEDQEPYPSILRPRVLPPNSDQNHWNEETKTTKFSKVTTSTTESSTDPYETSTAPQEDVTTTVTTEASSTPKNNKKRGYWKLIKLRKITDEFEVAESQNVGVVSINHYNDDSIAKEGKIHDKTESHVKDFDAFYTTFQLTTKKPENETDLSAKYDSVTTGSLSEITASTEIPTTATPLTPEEIETTTIDDQEIPFTLPLEDNSDLDDVTMNDDDSFVDSNVNVGVVETSTSTSTEISHRTEICYKGICEKMVD